MNESSVFLWPVRDKTHLINYTLYETTHTHTHTQNIKHVVDRMDYFYIKKTAETFLIRF